MLARYIKRTWLALIVALAGCSAVGPGVPPQGEQAQQIQQGEHIEASASVVPEMVVPEVVVPPLKAGTQAAYDQAVELLREGKTDEALQLFTKLTQRQPELAGPWVNVGVIHLNADRTGQAREAFEQALVANPGNCDALNQLGVMARREGRFDDAEAHYLGCLAHQPQYARARLNLAILYDLYMGRLGEALAAYHDYELMLHEPDLRVRGWVMDLERRVAAIAKR